MFNALKVAILFPVFLYVCLGFFNFFLNNTKLELHSNILDCGIFSLQPDLQSAQIIQKLLLSYFIDSEGLHSLLIRNEELTQENKQMKKNSDNVSQLKPI